MNHYTNRTEVLSILDYIEENTYRSSLTREMREFVMLAIEALTNGVEVDINEKLVSNNSSLLALLAKNTNGELMYLTNNSTTIIRHDTGLIALVEKGFLITNNGTRIPVFKNIDKGNVCFKTNSHGETFAEGDFWIDDTAIDTILLNDGYHVITSLSDVMIGDVLIYIENSLVVHSVTVVQTDGTIDGLIVNGLGGIETETTTENFRNAWGNAESIEIYRKLGSDFILTDEEIELIRNEIYGD